MKWRTLNLEADQKNPETDCGKRLLNVIAKQGGWYGLHKIEEINLIN